MTKEPTESLELEVSADASEAINELEAVTKEAREAAAAIREVDAALDELAEHKSNEHGRDDPFGGLGYEVDDPFGQSVNDSDAPENEAGEELAEAFIRSMFGAQNRGGF